LLGIEDKTSLSYKNPFEASIKAIVMSSVRGPMKGKVVLTKIDSGEEKI